MMDAIKSFISNAWDQIKDNPKAVVTGAVLLIVIYVGYKFSGVLSGALSMFQ